MPRDDSDDGWSSEETRRSFLGASALGLAGVALGSGGAVAQTDGGAENSRFAVREHDHSGDHGAAPRLGEESPVQSIDVTDLVTAQTPRVDVRAHGVVGDGETDDSAALRDAVEAATPHGVLHVPADLTVHLADTVAVDLTDSAGAGQNRFSFVCDGALHPEPGLGDAIHIQGGLAPYVFARVDGGGSDPETDTAVRVTGNRGGLFEGWATNYGGTVFEFENSATYSIGHLKTWNTGQSFAVYDASPMGEVQDVFDVSPVRAPEFHDSSDVCINQYENYMAADRTERGVVFDNCLSVWVDRLAVGGAADTPPTEFRDSRHMFVNALHLGGSPTWGGVIEDVVYSTFRVFCNVNAKGLKYAGSNTDGNRVVLNGQNLAENGLVVTEDVSGGYHHFAGNVVGTSALAVDVRTADAEVYLENFYAVGNGGGDLRVPAENDVHLSNCRFAAVDGTPKTVDGYGSAAADGDQPSAENWNVGDVVRFTDTGDGSGSGLYALVSPEEWFRFEGTSVPASVDFETVLAQQSVASKNGVPGALEADGSFGQSFAVDDDVSTVEFLPATFATPETAATMTLYEGSPADGGLSEVLSRRIDPIPDTQVVSLDVPSGTAGTLYLEMTAPEKTPTWWWHQGQSGLAALGGTAFVDREPVADTNFVITVIG